MLPSSPLPSLNQPRLPLPTTLQRAVNPNERRVKTDKNGASFLQIKIVPKVIPILLLKLSQMLTAGIPDNQKKLIQGSMPDTVADVNMLQDLLIMRAWNPFIFNSYTMV
ncbi:hypothetical protein Tco_1541214 [Tanacetum coccineum]